MTTQFKTSHGEAVFDWLTQSITQGKDGVGEPTSPRHGSWAWDCDVFSVSTPNGSVLVIVEGDTVRVEVSTGEMPKPVGEVDLNDPNSFDHLEKMLSAWRITFPKT